MLTCPVEKQLGCGHIHGGAYIIDLKPGASLERIPDHRLIRVEGEQVKVEFGEVSRTNGHLMFRVGDHDDVFSIDSSAVQCVKREDGIPVWEQ